MKRRDVLLLGMGTLAVAGTAAAHTAVRDRDVPEIHDPMPGAAPSRQDRLKVKPVSHWAAVFQKSWDYQFRQGVPLSRSTDSRDHYDLSYDVDSNVAMFRATDQRRYLDRALTYTENVVASARPSASLRNSGFQDRYRGWASSKSGENGDEVPLYESYFWRYGTALLTAIRDNPGVWADPGYRARYDDLLAFAESDVFEKWYERGADDTIYRERTHMASHWALIAFNLARLTGDAGRKARYTTVHDTIASRLRGQLRRNPVDATAYFWSDVWESAKRPGQDAGHGNGVIAYVVEARDRGTSWTDADMAAFAATLTKVVWPGGTTYHAFVDGTGSDNGWFADGFVKLGRYDPAVQLRLEKHQVVNDQFAANMALNARLLRG
ncbi:hypothetical protein ACTI_82750 [Actinoplanes sp. OR16]|uniref:hypothetical protein n=1 Tax=Actinoplanes sp. OR16 TaxID=946334 RepID=UPI000F70DD0B|nr:hypothetical protein [Actinoplanes sp. OR16]BBH71590.1 hypothetical protein ACTI_82750 [Actinoplanes sp. OR16]